MYKLNLQYWNKEKLASIVFVIVGLLMGRVVLFGGINGCAIGYLTCFLFNKNIFYAVAVTIFTGLMTVRKTMDIGEYVIAIVLMCLFNFWEMVGYRKTKNILLVACPYYREL